MPRGIPHSVFLGRVVGTDEPRWLADDQDKALAWLAEQALYCPHCGTRPDEWDPKQGGDHFAYIPELVRCAGCEMHAQGERDKPEHELGVRVVLVRNVAADAGPD